MADARGGAPRRRAADAAAQARPDLFTCPRCGRRLALEGEALECRRGHRYDAVDGVFDLWPEGRPLPRLDVFATPYGLAYDTAIKERWLARLGGLVGWGADVRPMFRLMDEGVKCEAGEVVLDVPVGGGPTLRAAPGRSHGLVVGIDLSLPMLARAARVVREESLERVVLARGDASHLPLADGSVDRVLCFNGLHVMPRKDEVLREFRRVLKPGGELWGSVVVVNALLRRARPWINGGLWFAPADPDALEEMARREGFSRWRTETSGSLMTFRAAVPASPAPRPRAKRRARGG